MPVSGSVTLAGRWLPSERYRDRTAHASALPWLAHSFPSDSCYPCRDEIISHYQQVDFKTKLLYLQYWYISLCLFHRHWSLTSPPHPPWVSLEAFGPCLTGPTQEVLCLSLRVPSWEHGHLSCQGWLLKLWPLAQLYCGPCGGFLLLYGGWKVRRNSSLVRSCVIRESLYQEGALSSHLCTA